MSPRSTIIVHNLDHACAALAAAEATGAAIIIESAPGAAAQGGAAWFREMLAEARRRHPGAKALAVLDCGAEPGLALGAIRAGIEAIRIRARADVLSRIEAIARASGTRIAPPRSGQALDLIEAADAADAAQRFLARRAPRR